MSMRSIASGSVGLFLVSWMSVAHAADAPIAAPTTGDGMGSSPAAPAPTPAATPAADHPAEAPASSSGSGEERSAKNAIYAEGLGPGLFYSINYERNIIDDLSARIGFGYLSLGVSAGSGQNQVSASASYLMVPISVSYLGIGSKRNIFELGAGATIAHVSAGASTFVESANASATVAIPFLIAGYRYQPADGGFFFKVGLSPMIIQGSAYPLPYLALGGVF